MADSDRDPGKPALLERGLILAGRAENNLSQAEILETTSWLGDMILATTHPGFGYKERNEDRIALVERREHNGSSRANFFVIDGMGGHIGGDIAAQVLAEELVRACKLGAEEVNAHSRELLLTKVFATIEQIAAAELIGSIMTSFHALVLACEQEPAPAEVLRAAEEIVKSEVIKIVDPDMETLRRAAEVVHKLSRMSPPGRTEVAVERAKVRVEELGEEDKPPDACYIGTLITSEGDTRVLDIAQAGDCKLFVSDSSGRVRFQSLNESYISEPDLRGGHLSLSDLMMYSLNRNIVSNSIYSSSYTPRRYRACDIPLELHPGDTVYLYSDGCDDLFSPDEIVRLGNNRKPHEFMRLLLRLSEKRMRYVSSLLAAERARRPNADASTIYPAVHQRMNSSRLRHGCYREEYDDGTVGKWLKPPKCDNFAFCMIRIAATQSSAATQTPGSDAGE